MLSAHMDEVGFVVTGIDDDGFLRFSPVGGIDSRVMLGIHVRIGPNKVKGVIGVKAAHLTTAEERKKMPPVTDMYIDIGAKSREEALKYFEEKGIHVLEINAKSGAGVKSINGLVQEACKEKIERDRKRGILNRPVRAMVVGIPNVGKSTFINALAGKAAAKTGNKPGVTKNLVWLKTNSNILLLDTPGIEFCS